MRCVINSDSNKIIILVSVAQTDLFTKANFDKSISLNDKIVV